MSTGLWLAELYFTLSSCLLEEFVSWKRARVFVPSTAKSGEQSDPQHFCGPGVRVLLLLLFFFLIPCDSAEMLSPCVFVKCFCNDED